MLVGIAPALVIDSGQCGENRTPRGLLPGEVRGHVLLTTQVQATGTLAQCVELPPLDQDEGALFLLRRAKILRDGTPLEDANRTLRMTAQTVSRLMEGLPLALAQAGAYIE